MPANSPPKKPPAKFQFSLAQLLLAFTAVALILGLSPIVLGTLEFFGWILICIFPAALIACVVYARGDIQAFAIGALVPFIPFLMAGRIRDSSIAVGVGMIIQLLITSGVCGIVTLYARHFLKLGRQD